MTAHPLYDSPVWQRRVYERFAITVVDGMIWIGSVIWLFRIAAQRDKEAEGTQE